MKTRNNHLLIWCTAQVLFLGLCSCLQAQNNSNESVLALDNAIAGLDPTVISRIKSDVPLFKDLLSKVLSQNSDLIVLVDKSHGLPAQYIPADLIRLDTVRPKLALNTGSIPLQLRSILIKDLQAMVGAAKKDGVIIDISSAYRSYEYQRNLFSRYVKELGKAEAERESAHAGASQHQLGLAMDFGSITPEFAHTPAGKWLEKHAATFGFSLSYPEGKESFTGYMYEPWHWRYIGIDAARLQAEFFGNSQQAMLLFLHDRTEALRAFIQKS